MTFRQAIPIVAMAVLGAQINCDRFRVAGRRRPKIAEAQGSFAGSGVGLAPTLTKMARRHCRGDARRGAKSLLQMESRHA